jgi:hypothetical protein
LEGIKVNDPEIKPIKTLVRDCYQETGEFQQACNHCSQEITFIYHGGNTNNAGDDGAGTAVMSNITFSNATSWQAVVDAADEKEEMDVEHQVGMQLELFNNTKATGMLLLSRELESMDISMVLDLAEARTQDAVVDVAVELRLSRDDSQGHW